MCRPRKVIFYQTFLGNQFNTRVHTNKDCLFSIIKSFTRFLRWKLVIRKKQKTCYYQQKEIQIKIDISFSDSFLEKEKKLSTSESVTKFYMKFSKSESFWGFYNLSMRDFHGAYIKNPTYKNVYVEFERKHNQNILYLVFQAKVAAAELNMGRKIFYVARKEKYLFDGKWLSFYYLLQQTHCTHVSVYEGLCTTITTRQRRRRRRIWKGSLVICGGVDFCVVVVYKYINWYSENKPETRRSNVFAYNVYKS